MTSRRAHIERLAQAILDGKGIGAIWQLHLDAAYAYRTGYPVAAAAILELVEAAEQALLKQGNARLDMETPKLNPAATPRWASKRLP